MSSNSSSNSSDPSADSDDNMQNYLAGAALAVSLVALIVSTFQLLQQYYGSTNGLASCSKTVIGKWARFTKRKFLWKEFRFEVRFCAPVLFVAPPTNVFGPLGDHNVQEITYLDGTNYDRTHTWTIEEHDVIRKANLTGRETVHTADNELSSWVTMLMAIQRMERESYQWATMINKDGQPPQGPATAPGFGCDGPDGEPGEKTLYRHTLAVGMQAKRRTWDAMPGDLKKPYATSAMCHIIEIMAMLGIHWKEFDRSTNAYRAQGNGFIVTGSMVPNLGIAFTFETSGKPWFQENRVVPEDKVKQLCFGYCPTLFQLGLKIPIYADEPKDYGTLQLGTRAEIAETLVSFACNTNTVNYFRLGNEHTRYSHLFPVPFEMLGMVGEILQIRHTPFTMLPNPTLFTWDKSAFSLINMLDSFQKQLRRSLARDHDGVLLPIRESPRMRRILEDAQIAVFAAARERDDKSNYDVIAATARYNDEARRMFSQRKNIQVRNDRSHTKSASASASSPMSAFAKAVTLIAWFLQPVVFFMRPLVLLVVYVGREFYKLLVQIEMVEDRQAKLLRDHKRPFAKNVDPRPSKQTMIDALHNAIDRCDLFLLANKQHAKYVFALHIEELMCYLNSRPYDLKDDASASAVAAGTTPASAGTGSNAAPRNRNRTDRANLSSHIYSPPPSDTEYYNGDYTPLHAIDTAAWADRDALLMKVYLQFIRKRILKTNIPKRIRKYTPPAADSATGLLGASNVPATVATLQRHNSSNLSDEARQMNARAFDEEMRQRSQQAVQAIASRNAHLAAEARSRYEAVTTPSLGVQDQRLHSYGMSRRHSRDAQVARDQDAAQQQTVVDSEREMQLADKMAFVSQAMLDVNSRSRRSRASSPVLGLPSASTPVVSGAGPSASAPGPSTLATVPSGVSTFDTARPSDETAVDPLSQGTTLAVPSPLPSPEAGRYTPPQEAAVAPAPAPASPQPGVHPSGTFPNLYVTRVGTASSSFTASDPYSENGGASDTSPPGGSQTGTVGILMDLLGEHSGPVLPLLQQPPAPGRKPNPARGRPSADATERERLTTPQDIHDIWCTLVLRMMLWLMLHDFHKKDVQISKSEVYDLRQPVYIL